MANLLLFCLVLSCFSYISVIYDSSFLFQCVWLSARFMRGWVKTSSWL
jgi:hypothetical protein